MTKKALDESIEHWKRLRDGTTSDSEGISSDSCALCQIYICDHTIPCSRCPIKEFTGLPDCDGTPYGDVDEIFENVGLVSFENRKKAIEGEPSQRMVTFLEEVKRAIYRENDD